MIRILYFGDIFGKPGRDAVFKAIDRFKKEFSPDFIVANVENATHGKGITPRIADEFLEAGVDVMTTGNHAWDQGDIIDTFRREPRLLRALNYAEGAGNMVPGQGSVTVKSRRKADVELSVVLLMGRVFMDPLDCPFHRGHVEIERLRGLGKKLILVDFHAEASSEKQAFTYYVDGRVTGVVGSHSHVQTADERILLGGTAAITDVGMCGCFDSVIGVKKEVSIKKFMTKMPVRFEPAEGPGGYGAVLIEADPLTGKATKITRFREVIA